MDTSQNLTILKISCDLTTTGRLPRKGEICGLYFFLPNSALDGHLLGFYNDKVPLHQNVGYLVYLSFKIQTAISHPLQVSQFGRLNMNWLILLMTN
jgi:hypothetical protein